MTGRVFIVTGANAGLGYEVSRYLCEGGNDVVMACRDEERGKAALEKIKRQNPNALATLLKLDLSSKESIDKFVEDFRATGKKLHVLINNAGLYAGKVKSFTSEAFEVTMGTNHLGHFYLTNQLLEDLKKAGADGGDARIVSVASSLHDPSTMKKRSNLVALDMEDIFLVKEGTYNPMQAYKNSKLANVLFTAELAKKLEGSGVTTNSLCPGFIPTSGLSRNSNGAMRFFMKYILANIGRAFKFTRTLAQGAADICSLAVDEKYKESNGKYYKNGAELEPSEEARDVEKQTKLWELSGGYLKMEGFEPLEVPPEPVKEEKKKEEEKKEEKAEEGAAAAASAEGEAAAEATGEEKKDEEAEKKEEGEKKEEEKKEEPAEKKVEEDVEALKKEAQEESKKEVEESKPAVTEPTKVVEPAIAVVDTPAEVKVDEQKPE